MSLSSLSAEPAGLRRRQRRTTAVLAGDRDE